MSSATVPEISVVVVAHDRKEFLLPAVDSVRQQSLERTRFDIVVVKNFEDPEIDRSLRDQGVVLVQSAQPDLGAKLAAGIGASRGGVLTFLEDDDLFEPQKLGRVARAFEADPGLGYFHNGYSSVDRAGSPIDLGALWQKSARTPHAHVRIPAPSQPGDTRRLTGFHASHNCSSISIRRSAVEPHLAELGNAGLSADFFLFLCGLMSGLAIGADNEPLTRIRTHSSNASPQSGPGFRVEPDQLAAYSEAILRNLEAMRAMVLATGTEPVRHVVEGAQTVEESIRDLRRGGLTRQSAFRYLVALFAAADTSYVAERRFVIPVVASGLVSPRVARYGYIVGKKLGY
jgi:Glycosyl transferase family 2